MSGGVRRMLRNPVVVGCLIVLLALVIGALFGGYLTPYGPNETDIPAALQGPSAAHWFGTDEVGRDVLARIIYGARASLSAGLVSVSIAVGIGVPLGLARRRRRAATRATHGRELRRLPHDRRQGRIGR